MHSHHWQFGAHGHHGGHGFRGRFGGSRGGGMRAARMLASADLQLIVLALVDEKPRHGYEIIKALEERSHGVYTPSPGVVYPALTYLEEMGFAISEAEANKKLYQITDSGKEHLAKNRALVDETLEQLSRFGRRMARVQKQFAEEEAENDFEYEGSRASRDQWHQLKTEFRELRAALHEKMDSPAEEKQRILAILTKAIEEIRGR